MILAQVWNSWDSVTLINTVLPLYRLAVSRRFGNVTPLDTATQRPWLQRSQVQPQVVQRQAFKRLVVVHINLAPD